MATSCEKRKINLEGQEYKVLLTADNCLEFIQASCNIKKDLLFEVTNFDPHKIKGNKFDFIFERMKDVLIKYDNSFIETRCEDNKELHPKKFKKFKELYSSNFIYKEFGYECIDIEGIKDIMTWVIFKNNTSLLIINFNFKEVTKKQLKHEFNRLNHIENSLSRSQNWENMI